MKLLFIRHGETDINAQGESHKTFDTSGLNELGKIQASKLAQICRENRVEIIFTSPEKRAYETAAIIAETLDLEVHEVNGLQERSWGEWQAAWTDIKPKLEKMTLKERYSFIPPKGESWEQMEIRVKKALDFVLSQRHQSVAIVTHGGVLRALMPILKKAPKETSFDVEFNNASVSIFDYNDTTFTEIKLNDSQHLYVD